MFRLVPLFISPAAQSGLMYTKDLRNHAATTETVCLEVRTVCQQVHVYYQYEAFA
jgi:hypothetical protein